MIAPPVDSAEVEKVSTYLQQVVVHRRMHRDDGQLVAALTEKLVLTDTTEAALGGWRRSDPQSLKTVVVDVGGQSSVKQTFELEISTRVRSLLIALVIPP